jgi:hypothetical protein
VSSVRALRPRPAPIQPGDAVVGLRLFDRTGSAFDLRRAFEPEPSARLERRAAALLLVFERVPPEHAQADDHARLDAIASARERLAVDAAEAGIRQPMFVVRPVAVFDVPDYSRGALEAFAARWSALGSDALLGSVEADVPGLLWTHPPRDSIDLFSPGAAATAVLIDGAGRLRGALRLDEAAANLEDWLVAALGGSGAGGP